MIITDKVAYKLKNYYFINQMGNKSTKSPSIRNGPERGIQRNVNMEVNAPTVQVQGTENPPNLNLNLGMNANNQIGNIAVNNPNVGINHNVNVYMNNMNANNNQLGGNNQINLNGNPPINQDAD